MENGEIDKISPILSTQVESLLNNDSKSRPTAEEMLLRLKRIKDGKISAPHHQAKENDEASNCSPLLKLTESQDTDNMPKVSWVCSSKLKVLLCCGIGLLLVIILAIVLGTSLNSKGNNMTGKKQNLSEAPRARDRPKPR